MTGRPRKDGKSVRKNTSIRITEEDKAFVLSIYSTFQEFIDTKLEEMKHLRKSN